MTPIHYFWVGDTISNLEQLTFASCVANGHEPWVWTYGPLNNLPSFVKLQDASTIMNREQFEHYLHTAQLPLANISDIFRYHLLHQLGGYYSDTDVVIVKNLDAIPHAEFFCSTHEYEWGECANGCLMKLAAGSAVSKFLVDECAERLRQVENVPAAQIEYCLFGPFVVQECVRRMPVKVLPYDYINPISWRWVRELIAYKEKDVKFQLKNKIRRWLPRLEKRGYFLTRNTFAVHLCNEMWKKSAIDKNGRFHPSSIYSKLKRRYHLA